MTSDKYYLLTLGCDKNTVDSENMTFLMNEAGYVQTDMPEEASVVIINTCSFIKDAQEESVGAILQAELLKQKNKDVKLVVAGCLAQRYPRELLEEIPNIDLLIGTSQIHETAALILSEDKENNAVKPDFNINEPMHETGRVLSTPPHYAYIKISEGCDKHCSFCVIPSIRGKQRSRLMEDIVSEARLLAEAGVKELIVIAQDTGSYGVDIYNKRMLSRLLSKLAEIEGISWIRLMYVYPETIGDELIEVMKNNPKILHYIDIPFQHCSDEILKAMNRPTNKSGITDKINALRTAMPDIAIRSSFICGFPGETEKHVAELAEFLRQYHLDRVGIFEFSREEGTKAFDMPAQIDEEEKRIRRDRLMSLQEEISESNLEKYIGSEMRVLIDEAEEDGVYAARSYLDAPEVDGIVYVYSDKPLRIGDFYSVTITDSMQHDLIANFT